MGARTASHAIGGLFTSEESRPERLKALLRSQVEALSAELGELKGSLMKVGQMLSIYGEYFLPPEANAFLKSLQSDSPPLAYAAIERVLKDQLTAAQLASVEIDPVPIASASLGQVHRARRFSDGRWLALKVQYPGVDQAIESDLRALRRMLSVARLVPRGPRYDSLFEEVRQMLHREVDYERELATTDLFRRILSGDPRYVLPETVPELSTARILATTLEAGVTVDSPEVRALSQQRRNALAEAALELFLRELFELRLMQTDPHLGNYRVRLGAEGQSDRLVLLDFGAVREFPGEFIAAYRDMVRGAFERDRELLRDAGIRLGMLREADSPEVAANFVELAELVAEPFQRPEDANTPELFDEHGHYDWGRSDLPRRVARRAADLVFSWKLRTPPRELLFLDRKMGGVFIFLSVLGAKLRGRDMLARILDTPAQAD